MNIKKINGYTIFLKQILGKGSYGTVYRSQQDGTKYPCATKIIAKKDIDHDQYLKAALFMQIKILKVLHSQNIVGFWDVMESTQNYYIIQDLCDGDLDGLMQKQGGRFPEDKAIDILRQICNGFLALVKQGIVHRDLKPANIMIAKGIIKIGDFGFAKKNQNHRVKNQSCVGTPLYMSIEILKGQTYTSKCDIWALGTIFYQLTHGMTPYMANTQFQLIKNIQTKPLRINNKLQPKIIDFIQKCLKVRQQQRISWDQLFIHPIFEGYFNEQKQINKQFQNKMKKIMSELRFMINAQNINVSKLFQRFNFSPNYQLKFQELENLLKIVNPHITKQQLVYFYNKLDNDNNGTISLKQLQTQMLKNNIQMRSNLENVPLRNLIHHAESFQNQSQQQYAMQIKIKNCFLRLHNALNKKSITLYKTFQAYDKDKSGTLQLNEFGKILRILDSSIGQQQVVLAFNQIDTDDSKTISFDELNSYYCKINGIPELIDLPTDYRNKRQKAKAYFWDKIQGALNFF